MHVLISPDSYKENINAEAVAQAINSGIKNRAPKLSTKLLPMSDGGEGAIELLESLNLGSRVLCSTFDPLMRPIESEYFLFKNKKRAWIELSKSAGIDLLKKKEKDPKKTTTYGVGILIKDAIEKGCKEIILGIGGSASNDAGTGLLSALGFNFLDIKNKAIPYGGEGLNSLDKINPLKIKKLKDISITIACDVNNPILGSNGSVEVFSEQKGASKKDKIILERGLKKFVITVKRYFYKDISLIKGGGAAGGVAAGMFGIVNSKIENGFSILSKLSNLENEIKKADLIITGEGKIDGQTINGKVPIGIAKIAKKYDKPVICIAGSIDPPIENLYKSGITGIFSIQQGPNSKKKSFESSEVLIKNCTERIIDFYMNILKL
tara:strand:- start:3218 stop:4354 length:1137 start_codon:yes stop_codon:yes gene_type:complete